METVATGDVVAVDPFVDAIVSKRDAGRIRCDVVHRHVLGGEEQGCAVVVGGFVKVLLKLCLAVGHHLPSGKSLHLHRQHVLTAPGQIDQVVSGAVGIHSVADPGSTNHLNGAPFENAGADSCQDVVAGLALENHMIDLGVVEDLGEQRSRWSGSDDHDVGAHLCSSGAALRGECPLIMSSCAQDCRQSERT